MPMTMGTWANRQLVGWVKPTSMATWGMVGCTHPTVAHLTPRGVRLNLPVGATIDGPGGQEGLSLNISGIRVIRAPGKLPPAPLTPPLEGGGKQSSMKWGGSPSSVNRDFSSAQGRGARLRRGRERPVTRVESAHSIGSLGKFERRLLTQSHPSVHDSELLCSQA